MQSGEAKVPSAPLDHLSIHATAAAEFCVVEFSGIEGQTLFGFWQAWRIKSDRSKACSASACVARANMTHICVGLVSTDAVPRCARLDSLHDRDLPAIKLCQEGE